MRADLLFELRRPSGVFKVEVDDSQWRIVSSHLPAAELEHLNQTLTGIRQAHPEARFSRTFPRTVARLREEDGPDAGDRELALFFRIDFTEAQEAHDAARELEHEPLIESLEILDILRDTCSGNQEYVGPSIEGGVGATWAWTLPGGKGEHVTICVIDGGWDATHPDLQGADIAYLGPQPAAPAADHGTNVVGVLAALPGPPVTGVAYLSKIRISSINNAGGILTALDKATDIGALKKGDVLLLERETTGHQPLESSPTMMAYFTTAASLGITVVEPAGNGPHEVGYPPIQPPWPPVFDLAPTGVREVVKANIGTPHAWLPVMVGAGDTVTPYTPTMGLGPRKKDSSNYGARVDCQGWGECVRTTRMQIPGTPGTLYTDFGDTSAASAIVAGVVAIMQSTRIAAGMQPLSPYHIRMRLRDNANGLPQPPWDEAAQGRIGPQPDLRKLLAIDFVFPMVFALRPFMDHWGLHVWKTPHLIPRPAPAPNAEVTFGVGSSWSKDLGEAIAPGKEGWIYLRQRNENPFDEMLTADLYWAYPGTYLGPSSWAEKPIGQVEMRVPGCREGEPGVAVGRGIKWVTPEDTTDPSLVAVFSSRWNETPLSAHSSDAHYVVSMPHFVVHRNIIGSPLAEGPCFWRFRLRVPGMPLQSTRIKVTTDLPRGTTLYIGLPPGVERNFLTEASMVRHRRGALLETRFGANAEAALARMRTPAGDRVGADELPGVWLACDAGAPSFPRFDLRPGEEVPIVIGVDRNGPGSASIILEQYATFPNTGAQDESMLIGRLVLATPATETSTPETELVQ